MIRCTCDSVRVPGWFGDIVIHPHKPSCPMAPVDLSDEAVWLSVYCASLSLGRMGAAECADTGLREFRERWRK